VPDHFFPVTNGWGTHIILSDSQRHQKTIRRAITMDRLFTLSPPHLALRMTLARSSRGPWRATLILACLLITVGPVQAQKKPTKPPEPPAPPSVLYDVTWISPPDGVGQKVYVSDLNNLGDVVGHTYIPAAPPRQGVQKVPWVWTAETGAVWAEDIAIVAPEVGEVLFESCSGINDNRIIVGTLRIGSSPYAFKLPLVIDPDTSEPIPQPVELNGIFFAQKINNWEDVLTAAFNSNFNGLLYQLHLFDADTGAYTKQTVTTLGALDNSWGGRGGGLDLNDAGRVVGRLMRTDSGNIRRHYGFVYNSGTRSTMILPGFVKPSSLDTTVSAAAGINELGQTVGCALIKTTTNSSPGLLRACQFNGTSKPTDMGVLSGESESEATDINNAAQVIGFSGSDGFLWTSTNKIHQLDNHVLPDPTWSNAVSIQPLHINDPVTPGGWGEIVGMATFIDESGTEFVQTFLLTP
jgi:hypothetical protein